MNESPAMRLATLALCLAAAALPAHAADIVAARYEDPTTRYDHGILGDAVEWGALVMDLADGKRFRLSLPETRVFEDTEPRLIALPDGPPIVAVVETDIALGARLALYRESGLVAATPYIGRTNRWLAPIGAADLDGDGALEFAYVDRPHLAHTIRIWRFDGQSLDPVAELPGYTNHRIGEEDIAGGIRNCGAGPEMVVADATWSTVFAISWDGATFTPRPVRSHRNRRDFNLALQCQ